MLLHTFIFASLFAQPQFPSDPHVLVRNWVFFYHKEGSILNCFLKFLLFSPQSTGNSISTFQLFHFDTVTLFFCLSLYLSFFFFATYPTFFLFPIAILAFSLSLVEQNQGKVLHESFKIFSVHFLMWRWPYYLWWFPSFLHRWCNLEEVHRQVVKNWLLLFSKLASMGSLLSWK